jgi:hypothetical protein
MSSDRQTNELVVLTITLATLSTPLNQRRLNDLIRVCVCDCVYFNAPALRLWKTEAISWRDLVPLKPTDWSPHDRLVYGVGTCACYKQTMV